MLFSGYDKPGRFFQNWCEFSPIHFHGYWASGFRQPDIPLQLLPPPCILRESHSEWFATWLTQSSLSYTDLTPLMQSLARSITIKQIYKYTCIINIKKIIHIY